MKKGKVYLVGAGPGDPLLISVKGAMALQEADVVVYDRLVSRGILRLAREDARLIYAGKEPGGPGMPQTTINRLLCRLASSGCTVVRLKGGDPLLFGRGGEEAEYLVRRGIDVEIVPGITSALAVPAYAGIPVTHRGVSRSVAVVTGHTLEGDGEDVDWEGIARSCDTVVVLMARESLARIVGRLLAAGLDPGTPAAAVQYGTTGAQRTAVATLEGLERAVLKQGIQSPLVLVFGQVVAMRERLLWWERQPLFGMGILLLRASGQEVYLSQRLSRMGANVIHVPAIRIRRNLDVFESGVLKRTGEYHWVVFTSPNAVDHCIGGLWERGIDSRSFSGARLVALGPGTKRSLQRFGLRADLMPDRHSVLGLMQTLENTDMRGQRLLLVRSELATRDLRDFLERKGASVVEVHPYRVEIVEERDHDLIRRFKAGEISTVLLTSPSTVRGLINLIGGETEVLSGSVIGCIGPVTAEAARNSGMKVDFVAETHSEEGLIESLLSFQGVS